MVLLASLLHQFGLDSSKHMVYFERLGVGCVKVCRPPSSGIFDHHRDDPFYSLVQDLQDVTEADIEVLGLKAVAKTRLLRLLSSQKVHTAAKSNLPFPCFGNLLHEYLKHTSN
jgi:hypothetical protein